MNLFLVLALVASTSVARTEAIRAHMTFLASDLLEGRAADLCVLRVPPCGWSDLGTPRRVGEIVKQLASEGSAARAGYLDLATQHAHFVSSNAQPDHLRLAR